MNERLFLALGEQLKHEIFFVNQVSRPYYSPQSGLRIIDFKYKSHNYQLTLNGIISLKTSQKSVEIESYDDLIHALIFTTHNKN